MKIDPFEIVGLAASFLVCVSLCMTRIKSLRLVNLAGSAVFIVYGVLIVSPSIIILNSFSSIVNIFHLVRMRGETARADLFDIIFVDAGDDHVRRFVQFHGSDIRRFFPSFDPGPEGTLAGAECCFILRETLPVSLVAYRRGVNEINIVLDYAIPAYRDLKNARFFFSHVTERLAGPGTVFLASGEVPAHAGYLKKIGFTETGREGNVVFFRRGV
jgi:hypothetical protein